LGRRGGLGHEAADIRLTVFVHLDPGLGTVHGQAVDAELALAKLKAGVELEARHLEEGGRLVREPQGQPVAPERKVAHRQLQFLACPIEADIGRQGQLAGWRFEVHAIPPELEEGHQLQVVEAEARRGGQRLEAQPAVQPQ